MSNTITVRLKPELARWLEEVARVSGTPKGQIVRDQLEAARKRSRTAPAFERLIGCVDGPADLSSRRGYQRK